MDEIVKHIEEAAKKSKRLYSQGGIVFTHTYGFDCTHSDLKSINAEDFRPFCVQDDYEYLEVFFENAIGTYDADTVSSGVKEYCDRLVELLYKQLKGWSVAHIADKDDTSMSVELAFLKGNNYHLFKMFWSID